MSHGVSTRHANSPSQGETWPVVSSGVVVVVSPSVASSPELEPERRAFDCGVLYDPAAPFEAALAERLQFGLRAHGLAVRANQPYKGTEPALVTSLRGELAGEGGGYAGIELETSHAVTRSAGGCARVAAAVVAVIEELRERA